MWPSLIQFPSLHFTAWGDGLKSGACPCPPRSHWPRSSCFDPQNRTTTGTLPSTSFSIPLRQLHLPAAQAIACERHDNPLGSTNPCCRSKNENKKAKIRRVSSPIGLQHKHPCSKLLVLEPRCGEHPPITGLGGGRGRNRPFRHILRSGGERHISKPRFFSSPALHVFT